MSDGLERVTLITPDTPPPEGHEAAMVAKVDAAQAAANPAQSERPAWLPAKFSTVEQLAESYAALEAKQSGKTETEVTPKPAAEVTPTAPAADQAAAVVASAGLDMASLSAEFAKSGSLSEASMASLAAKGVDKATVDNYIAGQTALASQFTAQVTAATPGGADKYGDMITWAKANLSAAEVAAYNTSVDTSDVEKAKLAVAGLGVRYLAATGSEPNLNGGRTGAGSGDAYESMAQWKAEMRNPLYASDPAFRAKVAAKLGRSSIF